MANEELQVTGSNSEHLQLLLELQKENQQLRMQVAQLQQKVLSLENKALACSTSAAVYQDGSLEAVARSPSETPIEKPVQKENMGVSGIDAAVNEKHFLHCTENKSNGVPLDCTNVPNQVNNRVNSHPDSVVTDTQVQVRCESTLLRTPLTLSSIKRKILMRTPLTPSQKPSLGLHSTSRDHFCRKRTFWDITNTNSPYAKSTCRNTRSNTQAETPSMLLQVSLLLFSSHSSPFKRLISCFDYIIYKRFTGA